MTQELKNTLKPCPFCGAEPKFENDKYRDHVFHGVITDECPIAGRLIPFEKWNTRAGDREAGDAPWRFSATPEQILKAIKDHFISTAIEGVFEYEHDRIMSEAAHMYLDVRKEWLGERKLRQEAEAKQSAQTEALRLAVEALELSEETISVLVYNANRSALTKRSQVKKVNENIKKIQAVITQTEATLSAEKAVVVDRMNQRNSGETQALLRAAEVLKLMRNLIDDAEPEDKYTVDEALAQIEALTGGKG